MNEEPWVLPESWTWSRIEAVVQPVQKVDPSTEPERIFRYVDVSSISGEEHRIERPKITKGSEAPTRARQPILPGDVLISTVRPYLRNIAIVCRPEDGDIASTAFCILRTNGFVEPKYLFYWLLTSEFMSRLAPLQRGISYPAVRSADVLSQRLPLPPLPEQSRIVSKLEAIFGRVSEAARTLGKLPRLAAKFRRAVLARAFNGELAWYTQGGELAKVSPESRAEGHSARHDAPKSEELRALPVDWTWTTLGDIVVDVQSGFASGKKDVAGGIPHLRMNNIGQDCRLNLQVLRTVPRELASPKYFLQIGDVLFCHTNSRRLVGKTAIFNVDHTEPFTFSNHLSRIRVDPGIALPQWVWHLLEFLWYQGYFETRCKQWVNQATVERKILLNTPIPLAPLEEQRKIVELLESMMTRLEEVDARTVSSFRRLEVLQQSVLAKAFHGALIRQDPGDEPISLLRERMRAGQSKGSFRQGS